MPTCANIQYTLAIQFLERNFTDLVNLKYTSNMEDELDNIALGNIKKEDYLKNFYYGENNYYFHKLLSK